MIGRMKVVDDTFMPFGRKERQEKKKKKGKHNRGDLKKREDGKMVCICK